MFIGLTNIDDEKILVNADNITYAERVGNQSYVYFVSAENYESCVHVIEDLSTILNRIRRAEALAK